MRLTSAVYILLLVTTADCRTRSQAEPEPKQYSVPAEIEPYVQTFRAEAGRRKRVIAADNLIIRFGILQGNAVCGECLTEAGKTPRITLSADVSCWKNANSDQRECLVFHELGHCLLNRPHRSDRFPNGAYVSLMNPGDVSVYATCTYDVGGDACDKRARRPYYLDELFDPATPAPVWGQ